MAPGGVALADDQVATTITLNGTDLVVKDAEDSTIENPTLDTETLAESLRNATDTEEDFIRIGTTEEEPPSTKSLTLKDTDFEIQTGLSLEGKNDEENALITIDNANVEVDGMIIAGETASGGIELKGKSTLYTHGDISHVIKTSGTDEDNIATIATNGYGVALADGSNLDHAVINIKEREGKTAEQRALEVYQGATATLSNTAATAGMLKLNNGSTLNLSGSNITVEKLQTFDSEQAENNGAIAKLVAGAQSVLNVTGENSGNPLGQGTSFLNSTLNAAKTDIFLDSDDTNGDEEGGEVGTDFTGSIIAVNDLTVGGKTNFSGANVTVNGDLKVQALSSDDRDVVEMTTDADTVFNVKGYADYNKSIALNGAHTVEGDTKVAEDSTLTVNNSFTTNSLELVQDAEAGDAKLALGADATVKVTDSSDSMILTDGSSLGAGATLESVGDITFAKNSAGNSVGITADQSTVKAKNITLADGSKLTGTADKELKLLADAESGSFTVAQGASVSGDLINVTAADATINETVTFNNVEAKKNLTIAASKTLSAAVNSSGVANVLGTIDGNLTSSGTTTVANGGEIVGGLTVDGGTTTFAEGATYTANNDTSVNAGSLLFNDDQTLKAVNVGAGAELSTAEGKDLTITGAVDNKGTISTTELTTSGAVTNSGTLTATTLNANEDVTNSGTLTAENVTVDADKTVTAEAGSTLNVTGTFAATTENALTVSGGTANVNAIDTTGAADGVAVAKLSDSGTLALGEGTDLDALAGRVDADITSTVDLSALGEKDFADKDTYKGILKAGSEATVAVKYSDESVNAALDDKLDTATGVVTVTANGELDDFKGTTALADKHIDGIDGATPLTGNNVFGSVKTDDVGEAVMVDGGASLTLASADASGNLVSDAGGAVAGVTLDDTAVSYLKLAGDGKVGDITGDKGIVETKDGAVTAENIDVDKLTVSSGTLTAEDIDTSNGLAVSGNLTAQAVTVTGADAEFAGGSSTVESIGVTGANLVVKDSGMLEVHAALDENTAHKIDVQNGGTLIANSVAETTIFNDDTIAGTVKTTEGGFDQSGKDITLTGAIVAEGHDVKAKTIESTGGTITAGNLTLEEAGTSTLTDSTVTADNLTVGDGNVEQILQLEGTTANIDTLLKIGAKSRMLVDPSYVYTSDLKLDGTLAVLKDSVVGVGITAADYDGSTSGANLYLNKQLALSTGTENNVYLNGNIFNADFNADADYMTNNASDVYLDSNSTLYVNASVMADEDTAAITGADNFTVTDDGTAKIVITGSVSERNYKITDTESDNVKIGDEAASLAGVTSVANVLYTAEAVEDENGTVSLKYNPSASTDLLSGISPSFRAAIQDQAVNGGFDSNLNNGLGYVSRQLESKEGLASRLNSFSGFAFAANAPQIGLMTSSVGVNAIAQRAGFSAQSVSSFAGVKSLDESMTADLNAQNSGVAKAQNHKSVSVWVTPMYKHSKSDSFKLEGSKYGASTNLYGLALGSDIGLGDNFRLGASFNVGNGKAKSKGDVVRTENKFDFYGLGLYGTYNYGDFGMLADITYTAVDGDVDQYGDQKLTSSIDGKVLTLGLTGKYRFATSAADIVPHAGIRYINNKVDSYKVKANGTTYLTGSSITQNLVEIPVGVTVSRYFESGDWLYKPLFDLTLTAVTGDKDVDAKTTIIGMDNYSIKTNADVSNGFRYSATFGFETQYRNNLGFGFGYGYTGSSDVKEHSLVAGFRYTF